MSLEPDGSGGFVETIAVPSRLNVERSALARVRAMKPRPMRSRPARHSTGPSVPTGRGRELNRPNARRSGASRVSRQPARPTRVPSVRLARAIAITSGKGGVGKSNIAVNLAVALSAVSGRRSVSFDADLGHGKCWTSCAISRIAKRTLLHVS